MERRIGQKISNAAWSFVEDDGYLGDALNPHSPNGEEDLFRALIRLLRVVDQGAGRAPNTVAPWTSKDFTARVVALSRLLGEEAAGRADILDFRRRVLKRDSPMRRTEAEAYLETPAALQPRLMSSSPGQLELLEYQNGHVAHDLHVWSGSPLAELRSLSERLAQIYPWQPGQAAAFVLEGLVPRATPFMLKVPQIWGPSNERRARVVLEVDAWVPVAAVAHAYREVRRQLLPGHNRPVSRRVINLINFVMQRRHSTWPELLEAWNSEHPTDAYSEYRHIRTAFERGRTSLESPRYRLYRGEMPAKQQRAPRKRSKGVLG